MKQEQLLASGEYMDDDQLAYFKALIGVQLGECQARINQRAKALSELEKVIDEADQASVEEERQAILRLLERDRNHLSRLGQAMARIDDRSYGYCEETGEPIGLARLLARPTTPLGIEAQSRQELRKKHWRAIGNAYGRLLSQ